MMQVFPSARDVDRVKEFCPVCHHDELIRGRVQSAGRNYFYPEKTKLWTFKTSDIPTQARMCARCGVIVWFGDTAKLTALRKEKASTSPPEQAPEES